MQMRPLCKSGRFHDRRDPRIAVHIFRLALITMVNFDPVVTDGLLH